MASVALAERYEVTVGDVYGLTQRGGSVTSHVRWTKGKPLPPLIPQNSLDILVAFEPLEGLRVLTQFGREDTVVIVNGTPIMPIGVQTGRFEYPDLPELWNGLRRLTKELRLVDATSIAQKLGNIQVLNMVMLGVLFGSGSIRLRIDILEKTLASLISRRYAKTNLSAFRGGIGLVESRQSSVTS